MKTKALLFLAALALPFTAAAKEKTVELKVEMPPVLLIGTPTPINVKNLESGDAAKKRTSIQVPEGTVNLAKGKTVTSSDKYPIVGDLEYVTDGDKDADEGYEVELAPGLQWVQIDLAKESDIYAVAVWHFHRQKRLCRSVIVQLSTEPEFKNGVTTIFNTDYEDSAKLGLGAGKDLAYIETNEGRVIPANGTKARYVRLYSNGSTSSTGNHYVEVEVFGKAAK